MALATGEVVPTPGDEWPYKVVIRLKGKLMGEIGVSSEAQGEALIVDILRRLDQFGRDEGDA